MQYSFGPNWCKSFLLAIESTTVHPSIEDMNLRRMMSGREELRPLLDNDDTEGIVDRSNVAASNTILHHLSNLNYEQVSSLKLLIRSMSRLHGLSNTGIVKVTELLQVISRPLHC